MCCTECPANFTYIASVNGCYKVVNRNLKWTAAAQECRSLHEDAHLLVINDAAEQLAVAGMLVSTTTSQCTIHDFCCIVCLVIFRLLNERDVITARCTTLCLKKRVNFETV